MGMGMGKGKGICKGTGMGMGCEVGWARAWAGSGMHIGTWFRPGPWFRAGRGMGGQGERRGDVGRAWAWVNAEHLHEDKHGWEALGSTFA